MAQGDGKKLKEQMRHDGKAQWNPTDAEKELFEQMTPRELLNVSTLGGNHLHRLRRWWMGKHPGSDVYDFYRAMHAWEAETNRALYG